jgi:hypothetical protein
MSNETHVDGAKMTNDLWVLNFMKRAAPQLRDLLPHGRRQASCRVGGEARTAQAVRIRSGKIEAQKQKRAPARNSVSRGIKRCFIF